MPLRNGHKTFIESVIRFYFDDLPTDKELLSAAITGIVKAIKGQSDNDYADFRKIFQQPWKIKRLESCDENYIPSIGDVREYIIEYVNGKIVAAAGEESPKNLGWDFERILEATKVREDNGYKLDGNLNHIEKGLSIGLSLEQVRGLKDYQVEGILLGLSLEQARGLKDESQLDGLSLGLSYEQVREDDFGEYTINGINALRESDVDLTVSVAYKQVRELEVWQRLGLIIGLSLEQVREENFGDYTIGAIMALRESNKWLSSVAAYEQVRGLDECQLIGLSIGLSFEQVREDNFGDHTIGAIMALESDEVTVSAAYEQVLRLNESQLRGLWIGLSFEQVNIANFGAHIVDGINALKEKDACSVSVAYKEIRGLNESQVKDITEKGFSRWQVQAKYFCQQVWHYVLFLVGVPAAIGAASRHYMHNSFTAVFDTLRFLRQRLPGTNNKARKDVYQKPPSAGLPLGDESCSAGSNGLGRSKEGLRVSTN